MSFSCFFFFNDTATTEIYTLSLHDALPISANVIGSCAVTPNSRFAINRVSPKAAPIPITTPTSANFVPRSEEHTSELQSRLHLVCRLLLEKKKKPTDQVPLTASAAAHYHLY